MVIHEFDRVELKSGKKGFVADILKPSEAYIVDIDEDDGGISSEVILHSEIASIVEAERRG